MDAPALERYPALEDVIGAIDACASLHDLLTTSLAAIDEYLGFSSGAFMLALAEPPLPGRRAYAGVQHGLPDYAFEEYFERWADADALTSDPARYAYYEEGWASIDGVYRQLDPARRRFVDDFLRRNGIRGQLSLRLACGHTDGYLTVMARDPFDRDARDLLGALQPLVTERLRAHLPRGVDGTLSAREEQVAELVALGFSNREIADVLHVEEDTVKKHVAHATRRLGTSRRTGLAVTWATGRRVQLLRNGA